MHIPLIEAKPQPQNQEFVTQESKSEQEVGINNVLQGLQAEFYPRMLDLIDLKLSSSNIQLQQRQKADESGLVKFSISQK